MTDERNSSRSWSAFGNAFFDSALPLAGSARRRAVPYFLRCVEKGLYAADESEEGSRRDRFLLRLSVHELMPSATLCEVESVRSRATILSFSGRKILWHFDEGHTSCGLVQPTRGSRMISEGPELEKGATRAMTESESL